MDAFFARRKAEKEKFKKDSPDVVEFMQNGSKFERNAEGIKKALEKIKLVKPKLKGTTFEREIEEYEQDLLSDLAFIEK